MATTEDREADGFGARLQALRRGRGWALTELAATSGVSKSALSKIERGEMSPTYDTLRKLADGFGLPLAALVSDGGAARLPADPDRFAHRLLATDAGLPFIVAETEVRAESLEAHGPWDSHPTADFLYCLEGRVALVLRDGPERRLAPGDSVGMDGRAPHAVLRLGSEPARILWVSCPADSPGRSAPQSSAEPARRADQVTRRPASGTGR